MITKVFFDGLNLFPSDYDEYKDIVESSHWGGSRYKVTKDLAEADMVLAETPLCVDLFDRFMPRMTKTKYSIIMTYYDFFNKEQEYRDQPRAIPMEFD